MSCLQDAASYHVLIFFSRSGYNHHQDFSTIDLLRFSAEGFAKSSSWKGVEIIAACSSWNKRILLKRCISPRTPSLTIGRFVVNGFSEKVLVVHFETPFCTTIRKSTLCPAGKQLCPTNLYKKRNLFTMKDKLDMAEIYIQKLISQPISLFRLSVLSREKPQQPRPEPRCNDVGGW